MRPISLAIIVLAFVTTACSGKRPVAHIAETARPPGRSAPEQRTVVLSQTKRNILSVADHEWDYFHRQHVVFDGDHESIPDVGLWEDDSEELSYRVNWYWRAVDKPDLTGKDCTQPWSAAFISWVMDSAGVPPEIFPHADAHWIYLEQILQRAEYPDAGFIPHSIRDYSPQPGDLVCAGRADTHISSDLDVRDMAASVRNAKLHCDIVVERHGQQLDVVGGNVRNSVSKTTLPLTANGLLQPLRRRPWFLILENRL